MPCDAQRSFRPDWSRNWPSSSITRPHQAHCRTGPAHNRSSVARSSSRSKGFARKIGAPRSCARLSPLGPEAEITSTGTCSRFRSRSRARRSDHPSMSGNIKSSSTTSGRRTRICSRAARPLSAEDTEYPLLASASTRTSRIASSSSTTSMCFATPCESRGVPQRACQTAPTHWPIGPYPAGYADHRPQPFATPPQ